MLRSKEDAVQTEEQAVVERLSAELAKTRLSELDG
jgi:hypothetical protein